MVVIDAANEAGRLLELIGDTPVSAIVTTHRHWDHWQALAEVASATGAVVIAHPDDAGELPVPATSLVRGGDRVVVGGTSVSSSTCAATPPAASRCATTPTAHSRIPAPFHRDSLFPAAREHRGRPERFGQLMDDLEERVFGRLPDGTWVYPGHGKDTTLGAERPHLAEWRERGVAHRPGRGRAGRLLASAAGCQQPEWARGRVPDPEHRPGRAGPHYGQRRGKVRRALGLQGSSSGPA
jgi:glyoxylase-like metal-dependent hydrolase (beta-lactamase superfamily II)